MPKIKIIFLDVDGTILLPDHSIQASTKKAIDYVTSQGIHVFLATGRPLHELGPIADELGIQSMIGYNGAYAVYQDKAIYQMPMDRSVVTHYLNVASKHNHELVLYTKEANLFTNLDKSYVQRFITYFNIKHNQLYQPAFVDEILGITIMNLSPEQEGLYQTDQPIFFAPVNVEGMTNNYDIIQDHVNKGKAIEHILKLIEIKPEQAVAFGDGLNDRQMLATVGQSFAMGNAHPELFKYAKYRTSTVNNDGIYNGLKQLGLV